MIAPAANYDQSPAISRKSPDINSANRPDVSSARNSKQQALLDSMFEIIAKDLVPLRPGREEPRAKKRRPKNYHLLTKPRHEMIISGHRNRPK